MTSSRIARGIIIAAFCFPALCQAADSPSLQAHVPAGWKLLLQVHGDLNADNAADAVLVLEKDDRALRTVNEGLGAEVLNLNPRRLLVLLRDGGQYTKLLHSDKLIPSAGDEESPCLADPLMQDGGIKIDNGKLVIDLNYWMSCGGWGVTHETYIFRYEQGRFQLIGEESSEYMRNSGESTESSSNYLSGKRKITTGINETGGTTPDIRWEIIKDNAPQYLDEMSNLPVVDEAE